MDQCVLMRDTKRQQKCIIKPTSKNVVSQINRIDETQEAIARIQMGINQYDESKCSAEEERDIDNTPKTSKSPGSRDFEADTGPVACDGLGDLAHFIVLGSPTFHLEATLSELALGSLRLLKKILRSEVDSMLGEYISGVWGYFTFQEPPLELITLFKHHLAAEMQKICAPEFGAFWYLEGGFFPVVPIKMTGEGYMPVDLETRWWRGWLNMRRGGTDPAQCRVDTLEEERGGAQGVDNVDAAATVRGLSRKRGHEGQNLAITWLASRTHPPRRGPIALGKPLDAPLVLSGVEQEREARCVGRWRRRHEGRKHVHVLRVRGQGRGAEALDVARSGGERGEHRALDTCAGGEYAERERANHEKPRSQRTPVSGSIPEYGDVSTTPDPDSDSWARVTELHQSRSSLALVIPAII
ncbi:hypothetical protein DFH07DRAFT_781025 [Mycena maculata]|uniref:Uncharacterized protein n=1 Tax=Mycena maculata TaxID=230809 RepID=A0AAD7MU57_9AGAR|nr:hypothetical protein DFH07DRAFT_781025 [Mycena maculata]